MTVIIHTTANSLDPNDTTTDADASLDAYVAEATEEILRAYPGTEVIHDPSETTTYDHRVLDTEDHYSTDLIQCILESVYDTGNFWR